MQKAVSSQIVRPQLLAVAVVMGLVMLPVAVWLDLRNLADETLQSQASGLNAVISDIRGYYARNVVGRVLESPDKTLPLHNYHDVPGAIPIPATLSIELGEVIGAKEGIVAYRFVSDYPFANRAAHALDAFERDAIESFRRERRPEATRSEITGSIFNRRVRVAAPVILGGSCVACHNRHPESPKHDWQVGDVRGIQAITVEQPVAANLFTFKFLLLYLFCAGAAGVTFVVLQSRQARAMRRMNDELETANSFLASVSLKIAKYLSPQIYKSIFSGEKDVSISTERKKLTIFFSDIQNFTSMSERLQPEELTDLLNEYFTEMSTIAAAHGATVDKFIGDAILAFFGDPETKGVVEDARACLRMAMEMQQRLTELNVVWRRRGLQDPFMVRMGINTGYCNVGNFGSNDRMDYTIIGAEANLAARLQSIAEPGSIVLSYETFALVQDVVRTRRLDPIRVKGINRDVVPYTVEGMAEGEGALAGVFNAYGSGMNVFIDVDMLDEADVQRLKGTLQSAIAALASKAGPEPQTE
ncbi:MAG: adenylate/guanylate cyclase domain-containing protein [Kiloniellaceae bacterium]